MNNFIEIATWISVFVLGPGAILVFAFFCRDFISMMREKN